MEVAFRGDGKASAHLRRGSRVQQTKNHSVLHISGCILMFRIAGGGMAPGQQLRFLCD